MLSVPRSRKHIHFDIIYPVINDGCRDAVIIVITLGRRDTRIEARRFAVRHDDDMLFVYTVERAQNAPRLFYGTCKHRSAKAVESNIFDRL